ncbi:MAG: hypothetical protein FJZ56_03925 [Chlamydiae bacterium]|nr:hypothetical protein [Chlamydiota bacterium]
MHNTIHNYPSHFSINRVTSSFSGGNEINGIHPEMQEHVDAIVATEAFQKAFPDRHPHNFCHLRVKGDQVYVEDRGQFKSIQSQVPVEDRSIRYHAECILALAKHYSKPAHASAIHIHQGFPDQRFANRYDKQREEVLDLHRQVHELEQRLLQKDLAQLRKNDQLRMENTFLQNMLSEAHSLSQNDAIRELRSYCEKLQTRIAHLELAHSTKNEAEERSIDQKITQFRHEILQLLIALSKDPDHGDSIKKILAVEGLTTDEDTDSTDSNPPSGFRGLAITASVQATDHRFSDTSFLQTLLSKIEDAIRQNSEAKQQKNERDQEVREAYLKENQELYEAAKECSRKFIVYEEELRECISRIKELESFISAQEEKSKADLQSIDELKATVQAQRKEINELQAGNRFLFFNNNLEKIRLEEQMSLLEAEKAKLKENTAFTIEKLEKAIASKTTEIEEIQKQAQHTARELQLAQDELLDKDETIKRLYLLLQENKDQKDRLLRENELIFLELQQSERRVLEAEKLSYQLQEKLSEVETSSKRTNLHQKLAAEEKIYQLKAELTFVQESHAKALEEKRLLESRLQDQQQTIVTLDYENAALKQHLDLQKLVNKDQVLDIEAAKNETDLLKIRFNELKNNHRALQEELRTLEQEKAQKETQIIVLQSQYKQEIDALSENHTEAQEALQNKLVAEQRELARLQQLLSIQNQLLDDQGNESTQLKSRIKELEQQLTKLGDDHNQRLLALKQEQTQALADYNQELEQQKLHYSSDLQRLELQLLESQKAREELEQTFRDLQTTASTQKDTYTKTAKEQDKKIQQLELEIQKLQEDFQQRLSSLQRENQEALEEVKKNHSLELETLKSELNKYQTSYESLQREMERLEKEANSHASDKSKLETEVQRLNQQLEKLQQQFERTLSEKEIAYADTLLALRQHLEASESARRGLEQRNTALEKELSAKNGELEELKGNINEIKYKISEAQRKTHESLDAKANENYTLKQRIELLEKQNRFFREQAEHAVQEQEKLKTALAELRTTSQKEIETLQTSLIALQSKCQELEVQNAELQKINRLANEKIQKLTEDLSSIRDENTELRNRLDASQQENATLEEVLNTTMDEWLDFHNGNFEIEKMLNKWGLYTPFGWNISIETVPILFCNRDFYNAKITSNGNVELTVRRKSTSRQYEDGKRTLKNWLASDTKYTTKEDFIHNQLGHLEEIFTEVANILPMNTASYQKTLEKIKNADHCSSEDLKAIQQAIKLSVENLTQILIKNPTIMRDLTFVVAYCKVRNINAGKYKNLLKTLKDLISRISIDPEQGTIHYDPQGVTKLKRTKGGSQLTFGQDGKQIHRAIEKGSVRK